MKKDYLQNSSFGSRVDIIFCEETKTLEFKGSGGILPENFKEKDIIKYVKKVVINGDICEIGAFTFEGYDNLEEVACFAPIEKIGHKAFYNCKKLKSFKTTSSLWFIGKRAFCGCEGLQIFKSEEISCYDGNSFYIQEPDDIFIGYHAFESCRNISEFNLIGRLKRKCGEDIEYFKDIIECSFSGNVKKVFSNLF